MCNYLADFGADKPLMIFWAVSIDAVFRGGTSFNLRLRVATALSTHCPLVAESGITRVGGSVACYQRLVFIF